MRRVKENLSTKFNRVFVPWSLLLGYGLVMDSAIKEEFDRVNDTLQKTDQRFDNLEGRFDNLEGRFDNLEGRFDNLEVRFDNLEGRFDHLEIRFDNLEGRFVHLEGRFDHLEGRFDQLEGRFDKTNGELSDLQAMLVEEFRRIDRRFDEQEQRLEEKLDQKFDQKMSHYFGMMQEHFDHRFQLLQELIAPPQDGFKKKPPQWEQHQERLENHERRIRVLEKKAQ